MSAAAAATAGVAAASSLSVEAGYLTHQHSGFTLSIPYVTVFNRFIRLF